MTKQKILITGNMGYVGPAVVRHLRRVMPQAILIGFDAGYFANCLTASGALPEALLNAQYFGDIREVPPELLSGIDGIVHLAAISNDPMGAKFEAVTHEINQQASIRLAELARDAGVRRFIFASSCSMYGSAADGAARKESDATNPLTAYARSKVGTENALKQLRLGDMGVTCLRFATACGMSDRLRLDLVLNDFAACATTSRVITVLSDGSPWRPLIDVADMARAIEWALSRGTDTGGQLLSVNVGRDEWNYQVKDLAHAVAAVVPGTEVNINAAAPPDGRSYRVNFDMFKQLAPQHQPQVTLDQSIRGLISGLQTMHFSDSAFRNSTYMRLKMLDQHISAGTLTPNLQWSHTMAAKADQ
jgi:nucleoside-diphosphate-sugar epimerase